MTDLSATRRLVQVRLPADLVKQIDHMAVEWGLKRGPAIERLLWESLTYHMEMLATLAPKEPTL